MSVGKADLIYNSLAQKLERLQQKLINTHYCGAVGNLSEPQQVYRSIQAGRPPGWETLWFPSLPLMLIPVPSAEQEHGPSLLLVVKKEWQRSSTAQSSSSPMLWLQLSPCYSRLLDFLPDNINNTKNSSFFPLSVPQRDHLCQLAAYWLSTPVHPSLLCLVKLKLNPVSISSLPAGKILGFVNRRNWKATARHSGRRGFSF